MPKNPPPERLQHVPKIALDIAKRAVKGNWDLLTADAEGSITIHNRDPREEIAKPPTSRPATFVTYLPTVRPRKEGRRSTTKAAPARTPAGPTPKDLPPRRPMRPAPAPAEREPARVAPPVVKEILEPATPAPTIEDELEQPGFRWIVLPGLGDEADWERLDLPSTAHALAEKLSAGLPPEAPLLFHNDVTALHGVDLEMVESVARQPSRVEIAPETKAKRYAVLRFHRGDVCTVVGFRVPHEPKVIAAYVSGEALKEYERNRDIDGGTGGGGARKSEGVPHNPRALLARLRSLGADCEVAEDGKTATVKFEGEDLGKVTVDGYSKHVTASDWQRMQRKIHALRRRAG